MITQNIKLNPMKKSIKVYNIRDLDADGVIITDEVLKIFGGNIDPSKIKIGKSH